MKLRRNRIKTPRLSLGAAWRQIRNLAMCCSFCVDWAFSVANHPTSLRLFLISLLRLAVAFRQLIFGSRVRDDYWKRWGQTSSCRRLLSCNIFSECIKFWKILEMISSDKSWILGSNKFLDISKFDQLLWTVSRFNESTCEIIPMLRSPPRGTH